MILANANITFRRGGDSEMEDQFKAEGTEAVLFAAFFDGRAGEDASTVG